MDERELGVQIGSHLRLYEALVEVDTQWRLSMVDGNTSYSQEAMDAFQAAFRCWIEEGEALSHEMQKLGFKSNALRAKLSEAWDAYSVFAQQPKPQAERRSPGE